MPALDLQPENYQSLLDSLMNDRWVVACLCAEWCGTCRGYREGFVELAEKHEGKDFVWIDIEDQSDVVGDLDVEDFPMILIQRGDVVAYFASVLPDHRQLNRLIESLSSESPSTLMRQASSSPERIAWQKTCNLKQLLRAVI